MKKPMLRGGDFPRISLFALTLLCLHSTACFRSFDPGKLKCDQPAGCPDGFHCKLDKGSPGFCVANTPGSDSGSPLSNGDALAQLDGLAASDGSGIAKTDALGADGTGSGGITAFDGNVAINTPIATGGTIVAPTDASPLGGSTSGGATSDGSTAGGTTTGGIIVTGGVVSAGGSATGGIRVDAAPDAPMQQPDTLAALGAACTSGTTCVSGVCADGVCCNTACTEQCKACNLPSSKGTCTRLGSGQPVTNHTACLSVGTTCGGACNGSADTCYYPGSTQPCGPAASCSGLQYQAAGACNSGGTCSIPVAQTCSYLCSVSGGCTGSCPPGDYRCGGSGRQLCSAAGAWQNNDCPTGQTCSGAGACGCAVGTTACGTTCCDSNTQYCSGTTCTNKKSVGSCTNSSQCTTNYCVGGYCCGSSSCGTGQTCSTGTCQCSFTLNTLADVIVDMAPASCTPFTVTPSPAGGTYVFKWYQEGTEVDVGNEINPGTSTMQVPRGCSYAGVYHVEVTSGGCTARTNDARLRFRCPDQSFCGEIGTPASCP